MYNIMNQHSGDTSASVIAQVATKAEAKREISARCKYYRGIFGAESCKRYHCDDPAKHEHAVQHGGMWIRFWIEKE